MVPLFPTAQHAYCNLVQTSAIGRISRRATMHALLATHPVNPANLGVVSSSIGITIDGGYIDFPYRGQSFQALLERCAITLARAFCDCAAGGQPFGVDDGVRRQWLPMCCIFGE